MAHSETSFNSLKPVIKKLLEYCQAHDWAGYDPYDFLNSRLLKSLKFLDSRLPRLAITQIMKKSPVNFRPLMLVPQTQNPKAIALFLMALLKLSRQGFPVEGCLLKAMAEKLEALRSPGTNYSCWGYSFPWQTRTQNVPRGFPNLVCTVFVANALLDFYDRSRGSNILAMALDAANFIFNELYWEEGTSAGFCYPLLSMRAPIHNANFLGAALLGRIYQITGEKKYLEPALRVARFSLMKQNVDGSWYYGELPTQRWIDNFHTGYNLLALRSLDNYLATTEFSSSVRRGFQFYRDHFFRNDGASRYFHDRDYPLDIHCVAQSLLTLTALKDLDENNIQLSRAVFDWSMTHMWDERGYFYYQVHPWFKNRISYMRWSQAWMLLALSVLLEELSTGGSE